MTKAHGTYMSTTLAKESYDEVIRPIMERAGIAKPLPEDEHHVTILYAPTFYIPRNILSNPTFMARVTGAKVLGEGEWQGLVLTISCPPVIKIFNKLLEDHGDIHMYGNELVIHLTVKYKPDEGDLAKLEAAITKREILMFNGVITEALEHNE